MIFRLPIRLTRLTRLTILLILSVGCGVAESTGLRTPDASRASDAGGEDTAGPTDSSSADRSISDDAGPRADAHPIPDSGLPEQRVLLGAVRPDCGPTDGPAWFFMLTTSPLLCGVVPPDRLTVALWVGDLAPGTYALPRQGHASACSAGECVPASSAALVIERVDETEVSGRLQLNLGEPRREVRFTVIRCTGQRRCG